MTTYAFPAIRVKYKNGKPTAAKDGFELVAVAPANSGFSYKIIDGTPNDLPEIRGNTDQAYSLTIDGIATRDVSFTRLGQVT